MFNDKDDFIKLVTKLENDIFFYEKCLKNQEYIFSKYFNIEWIRNYILRYI